MYSYATSQEKTGNISSAAGKATTSNPLQLMSGKSEKDKLLQKKSNPLQLKGKDKELLEKKSVQLKASSEATSQSQAGNAVASQSGKKNSTGLPDTLKQGVEALSGYSMDDVRVHYNSSKPAQLQALAYAQGTDIHVAPGQEQHLPHEAWHVVQQKQGRVQPTVQMKQGVAVNDDKGLETEADVMGKKSSDTKPVPAQKQTASGNINSSQPIQCNKEEAAKKIQARIRGYLVRKRLGLGVKTVAPGIIHTKIKGSGRVAQSNGTPIENIQKNMQEGAVYDRLTVNRGKNNGMVLGTKEGQGATDPAILAEQAPENSAVINGGYFVHKDGLIDNSGKEITGKGRPVGPTLTRGDHSDIPQPWSNDYGHVTIGGNVGLSSGPILTLNGQNPNVEAKDQERFQYRVGGADNPLNKYAGALTHASDANERSAISVHGNDNGKVVMHTLTAGGQRSKGANMEQWQNITQAGVQSTLNKENRSNFSTLNLDGGGSVYMGVKKDDGFTKIARGGGALEDQAVRPVANIVASQSELDKDSEK